MAIERPTFHESWYRVAELHPRLRSTVQISRQHFRGQLWHVVQDHTNNAFFRLAEPAYRFIGLLDGKRSVATAWKDVNEQLGDDAPTQGEVIQLLGQLYTSNLLQAEVPADTHTLFARYKKRKTREITGYLMNIMFARVPLVDPDAFLNRWISVLGLIFSPVGLVVWLGLIGAGIYSILQRAGWQEELGSQAKGLLSPGNLILLYVAFAFIKAFHEMGHAISCKKFGQQSGTGGEVHVIGIMLLVFTPVPYVDASSSWAMTNKWHRAMVGAAGMWVELGIASIAAMVWANTGVTGQTGWVHAFAYNVMFVASFSTVLFNANPLLRYDGYYILSDLVEIPNLGQRANEFIYYLVKRYVWGVKFARNPSYENESVSSVLSLVRVPFIPCVFWTEEEWLFMYAIASFLMRAVVSVSILFYLAGVLDGALILVAAVMAVAGIATWVLVPIGKFFHYLTTNPELARVRVRAMATTGLFIAVVVIAVGAIPLPDRARAQGVVEPAEMQELYAGSDGFVKTLSPAITEVGNRGGVEAGVTRGQVEKGALLVAETNPDMEAQWEELQAEKNRLITRWNIALTKDPGEAKLAEESVKGIAEEMANMQVQMRELNLHSPLAGVLAAPDMESRKDAFVHRGEKVGVVASLDKLIIRAAAPNELGGLDRETEKMVEIRVDGRPEILLTGVARQAPAGSTRLPSAALGYQVGGELNTAPDDREGTKTVENFFEVRIDQLAVKEPADEKKAWEATGKLPLLPGQRVVVRFSMRSKPAAAQVWTSLLQLFQRKFQI